MIANCGDVEYGQLQEERATKEFPLHGWLNFLQSLLPQLFDCTENTDDVDHAIYHLWEGW